MGFGSQHFPMNFSFGDGRKLLAGKLHLEIIFSLLPFSGLGVLAEILKGSKRVDKFLANWSHNMSGYFTHNFHQQIPFIKTYCLD